jgi:hypothetical protein
MVLPTLRKQINLLTLSIKKGFNDVKE